MNLLFGSPFHKNYTVKRVWVSRHCLKLSGMLQVVSEKTSPNKMWFEDEPIGSWWHVTPDADEGGE
ncbi:hypothetical protein MTR_7g071340 [Medicago truncatula]|uniref:Uncharacterized protein n=1 Tax=Medicago truncatula TaxID=3880 RepID=G7KV30_MEDTR|nr:hypothetical protein MTR_7g071340 [Medicago truncatula]